MKQADEFSGHAGAPALESPRQRLLALRLRQRELAKGGALARQPRGSATALSYAQEGLWFLDQMGGSGGTYNVPLAVRLSGELDVQRLERSVHALVVRHESLRSGFEQREGAAVQVVHPAELACARLQVQAEALGEHAAASHEQALAEWLQAASSQAFDLSQAPLLRVRLLRFSETEHVLLLVLHHIVCDGWSLDVLKRELGAVYAAHGDASGLPELAVQFADYALWQRERLGSQALQRQLQYWRGQLQGVQTLELPTDRVRPARASQRGGVVRFELEPELLQPLKALARRENATLFMLLLAAFQTLLMRYARQEDVAVGVPVAGRQRAELEGLIGHFVNTVVLRSDLSGNPRFSELLGRVKQSALDAFSHQELPFDRLVAELSPQRELSRNPLYQVSFTLNHASESALQLSGLAVQALPLHTGTAKFDLLVSLTESDQGLEGLLEYATDLFEHDSAERLLANYLGLLRQLLVDPDQPIGEVCVVTDTERQRIAAWNASRRDYPRDVRLGDLIRRGVQAHPDATAIIFEQHHVSYRELDDRAWRLAGQLRAMGAGPGTLVGVCLERSVELVSALVGVVYSGAAYVPLDPSLPPMRLANMCDDAALKLVVTRSIDWRPLASALPASLRVIDLSDAQGFELPDPPARELVGSAEDAAYVIFTSGSTGRPKGAINSHRGIVNRLLWMQDEYVLGAHDRVMQKTPYSFDVSVWEFFWPLMTGASIVVARPGGHRDSAYLAELAAREAVTLMHFVPSMLRIFLDEDGAVGCAGVRRVICSGEALPHDLVEQFFERLPGVKLANLYGPTEAAVDVTYWECEPGDLARTVPIGRPVANTSMYVLDTRHQVLPIGVPGELYIGGVQVGGGYVGRPDLTAERFVADPFVAGGRMYRTGDIGRWRADGAIEYLGRCDQQLKIRGNRVELGEIEAHLAAHPQVARCVVVPAEESSGELRLVAYVVPRVALPALGELRRHARAGLPDYMLPQHYVVLDHIPLLPSGKLDRKALPVLQPETADAGFVAPRSPIEETIAEVWSGVLRGVRVGAHDNFFDLGGHSLLAMTAMSRLRNLFGGSAALQLMFEAPTVAQMALHLGADTQGEHDTSALTRQPRGSATALSYAQEGLWFLDQMGGSGGTYNVPLALRLSGELDVARLERSVHALVARHESLRSGFEQREGAAVQVVHPAELACARLQVQAEALGEAAAASHEQALAEWLQAASSQAFDLSQAPLLRVRLLRLGETEHVLLLVLHHIVCDGWSLDVLKRELGAVYAAHGDASGLPELAVQFADYALWQRERLGSQALQRQLQYWRGRLQGVQTLELPTDRVRPARASQRGGVVRFELEPELLQPLKALARRENATLFMLLLAAFQTLLMRYARQEDVAVGVPVAGRQRAELEGLIGHFVNTVVLRSDLSGNPRFSELLGRVRQSALDAFSHQELPFDRLVAELSPQRELSRNPLYQVSFTLNHASESALQLSGLAVQALPLHTGTAKFDLLVSLTESDQGLDGTLQYSSDLFDAQTAERWVEHFGHLLRGVIADPDRRLWELPLQGEAERHRVLVEWNDTLRPLPPDSRLHRLFEAQAARTPDATAVVCGEQQLCYRDLNVRAERLADHLRRLGVSDEQRVGVLMPRGLGVIVSWLAILKAGGAYLPLDPEYPPERIAFMLRDCRATLALAAAELGATLPSDVRVLPVNDAGTPLVAEPPITSDAVTPCGDADNPLAYVIYTSGSTGVPKGVLIPQRAVARLVLNTDFLQLVPANCVAQASNCGFDAATFEVWGALLNGARLVIVPKDVLLSPDELSQHIARHSIDTLFLTTSLFNEFAASRPAMFGGLKHLLIGGEAADPVAVRRVMGADAVPGHLLNMYGPTETTTFATWFELPHVGAVDTPTPASIPIGRPIANTRCLVLDPHLQPQPVGLVGELYLGGAGLARGYVDRPELTAERFIADPHHPGERLYRTGDLVRWRDDGQLMFVGRADEQIKLRGFRIELGEIEAALSACDEVVQSAVVLREDTPGEKRLVAYLVTDPAHARPALAGLRERLAQRLPQYMLPSAFVFVDSLPLTPNGKLDRGALPAPGERPEAGTEPATSEGDALERELQSIWEQTLERRPIALDDDFFELGGHSLSAIRLLAGIERRLGMSLRAPALFEAPTVRKLAALIRQPRLHPASTVVAVQPAGDRPALFFVPGGGGELFTFNALARELGSRQPLYVLDIYALGEHALEGDFTLADLARRLLADMRRVQPGGPYNLAGYSLGGKVILEMARQLRQDGQRVALLALLDCNGPGYPRKRAFPVRVLLHLRHALALRPSATLHYLAERARHLGKYFVQGRPPPAPKTPFHGQAEAAMAPAQAMERVWVPVMRAWRRYVPGLYPGPAVLIRADAQPQYPGTVYEHDMCWGKVIGGGVSVEGLPCTHLELLQPAMAAPLARLLEKHLAAAQARVPSV